jgi:hypothetical protein
MAGLSILPTVAGLKTNSRKPKMEQNNVGCSNKICSHVLTSHCDTVVSSSPFEERIHWLVCQQDACKYYEFKVASNATVII